MGGERRNEGLDQHSNIIVFPVRFCVIALQERVQSRGVKHTARGAKGYNYNVQYNVSQQCQYKRVWWNPIVPALHFVCIHVIHLQGRGVDEPD